MKLERVLITGCGGMLGNAIYPSFNSWYDNVLATDKVVNEDWLTLLDIRDSERLYKVFNEYKPNIVLHLAAETDLEFCETYRDVAKDTNDKSTKNIAQLSEEFGATLIYISTAGVFNGEKRDFYAETDPPNPIMVYGETKRAGEVHALERCSKSFVVRAGWMMGGGREKEKKFTYKLLKQIKEGCCEIFAVVDKWGTPTYTYDFAMNLFLLIETRKYGLYHMVCEGKGTRYDVAKEILRLCNRQDIKLTPVNSDFFDKEYFAPRPSSEALINKNLNSLSINHMRPWKHALCDYIKNYFSDYIYIDDENLLPYQGSDTDRSNIIGREYVSMERRKDARTIRMSTVEYSIRQDQSCHSSNGHSKGIVINHSDAGLCMYVFDPLQVGDNVVLNFKLGRAKDKHAIIQWLKKEKNSAYKAGLQFV